MSNITALFGLSSDEAVLLSAHSLASATTWAEYVEALRAIERAVGNGPTAMQDPWLFRVQKIRSMARLIVAASLGGETIYLRDAGEADLAAGRDSEGAREAAFLRLRTTTTTVVFLAIRNAVVAAGRAAYCRVLDRAEADGVGLSTAEWGRRVRVAEEAERAAGWRAASMIVAPALAAATEDAASRSELDAVLAWAWGLGDLGPLDVDLNDPKAVATYATAQAERLWAERRQGGVFARELGSEALRWESVANAARAVA